MITISGASDFSRYVPVQGNAYRIEFNGIIDDTSAQLFIHCSGSGSIPFSFGIDNGSFFTSGSVIKKLYPISSSSLFGPFAMDVYQNGYNVYLNGVPIAFGIVKSSGALERLVFDGNGGDWTAQANVRLYGDINRLSVTSSSVIIPRMSPMITGVPAFNNGDTPIRVLLTQSTNFDSATGISPTNLVTIHPGQSGILPFSGQYNSESSTSSMLLTYSTDGQNDQLSFSVFPTQYSGEGIRVTIPPFGALSENIGYGYFTVENTGTVSKQIAPYITTATVQIPQPYAYMHSGFTVTCSSGSTAPSATGIITGVTNFRQMVPLSGDIFGYSDIIQSPANTFSTIQRTSKNSVFYALSGSGGTIPALTGIMNHAGRSLGAFCAQQLGHHFTPPFAFAANYIDLPLRADGDRFYFNSGNDETVGSTLNFQPEDCVYLNILSGNESGTVIATGSVYPYSSVPNRGTYMDASRIYLDFTYPNGNNPCLYATGFKRVRFNFADDVVFESGQLYTILLSGSGQWMTDEVSGQRHITWQSIYNHDLGVPNDYGTVPRPIGMGTGFCFANHITGFPVRPFMYDGESSSAGGLSSLTKSGNIASGVTQFVRFRPSGDYHVEKIVLPINCEGMAITDSVSSLTGCSFHVIGMTGTDYPDQNTILFDIPRTTESMYVYDRNDTVARLSAASKGYCKEVSFDLASGYVFNSGVDYWFCFSGENYPKQVGILPVTYLIDVGMFDTDFEFPNSNPIMSSGSNIKFMTYDYRSDFWYTGDNTRTYKRWPWFRLLGSGSLTEKYNKQYFEAKQVFCFALGHNGNIWDCNFQGGSGTNEHRYGYDYQYTKYQSDKMFQIVDSLPADCNAGFSRSFTVRYDGSFTNSNWGTLHIPEFGYTGLFSGLTT